MLSLLCPKEIVNVAIPVLMAAYTLAQHLGILLSLKEALQVLSRHQAFARRAALVVVVSWWVGPCSERSADITDGALPRMQRRDCVSIR